MDLYTIQVKGLLAASAETAYNPDTYKGGLDGHCGAIASLVQKLHGGDLLGWKVNGEPHIWNRLPDGRQVDLLNADFEVQSDKFRVLPNRKTLNPRFALFHSRVEN
jgi:hypothetical protein